MRLLLAALLVEIALASAAAAALPDSEPLRKEIQARRANPHSPRVDGQLDDPAWRQAVFVSDFLQKEPVEGVAPTERTEVAIVYDDDAIYIGARCYSDHPENLRLYLDRRDRQGPAEQFIVTIDSYLDRRTGYGFGVNTAGVRFDRYNPEDFEYNRDYTYDPIWSARTHIDSVSWTTEMRIPFSQLRFNDRPEQVWGINFNRWVPSRNEDIYWVYVPRDETGWASRFGNLTGIQGIRPSRRLELLPFLAGNLRAETGANPITDPTDKEARAGADLKMGLGSHMTLDATFHPDFGQVEADPAVVNLSAFETFFSERRPFFLEGSQILRGQGPGYYYSRRIGARSRILGAGKVTGRLRSGLSLGALAAVTERNVDDGEPLTGYGIGRVQQQFGPHQSTVGLSLTTVSRALGSRTDFLDSFRSRAYSGGTDWNLRFNRGMYEFSGFAGFSHIEGSPSAILSAQQSSARYFQRPDADYVHLDSTRTSLSGYTAAVSLKKNAGRHWLWEVYGALESPGFELNDAGQLSSADDMELYADVSYRETNPGSFYRSYRTELRYFANWNYGGSRQSSEIGWHGELAWSNFWSTSADYEFRPAGQDDTRTRGGPSMRREAVHAWGMGVNSNFAATSQYGLSAQFAVDELDGWLWAISGRFSTRLGHRLQLSFEPGYRREDRPRQYVTSESGAAGGVATYGVRYVFSRIAQRTLSTQIRANYFFTPDLSVEVYAEPFAARGSYYDFGELEAAGSYGLRLYERASDAEITAIRDTLGRVTEWEVTDQNTLSSFRFANPDFNLLSFRSNVVLRWEFHPGSTLFIVWQRDLGESRAPDRRLRPGSLIDSFGSPGADFFAFKIAYWLPIS